MMGWMGENLDLNVVRFMSGSHNIGKDTKVGGWSHSIGFQLGHWRVILVGDTMNRKRYERVVRTNMCNLQAGYKGKEREG